MKANLGVLVAAFLLAGCDDGGGGTGGTAGGNTGGSTSATTGGMAGSGGSTTGTGGSTSTGSAGSAGSTMSTGGVGGGGTVPAGEPCGQSANGAECQTGLACCYPCGIPDCEWVCTVPCEAGSPGCENGCLLVP